MAARERGGGPVEISMRLLGNEDHEGRGWCALFALQLGDRQIEVTNADDDVAVGRWIQEVHRVHRERLRGGRCGAGSRDLVVGFCTFRLTPCFLSKKEKRDAAKRPDGYPISAISLSAGGTHCLVSPVLDGRYSRRPVPHCLAAFLADRRNTFVGIGIKKAAERLERICGVHVANASELRPLVAGTFGRDSVPPLVGGGGDADGLRRMAKVVLRVDAGKRPPKAEAIDWCCTESDAKVMHAAVDAFLTCEVAEACLDAINVGTGSHDSEGVL